MKLPSFLYSQKCFPNIYLCGSPFKIYEWRHLMNLAKPSAQDLILDFGCGSGIKTCLLGEKAGRVVGVDICDLEKAKEKAARVDANIEFVQNRIQDAPLTNGAFDKIYCVCVLQHIPDYAEILRRCYTLLREGGELIVSVDCLETVPEELQVKHDEDHLISQRFEENSFRVLFEEIGFQAVDVHPILRGALSLRVYCDGIRRKFNYSFCGMIWRYLLLRFAEAVSFRKRTGLYLVAHCRK